MSGESHRILLFGSWTTLEAAPTSDIDIAIEGATVVDSTVMSEIHEEIDKLPTLGKIQIIDIQQVHDRFQDRVLSQGQALT
jgi:predicted nucleotidyltransferase